VYNVYRDKGHLITKYNNATWGEYVLRFPMGDDHIEQLKIVFHNLGVDVVQETDVR
jgi:hypothetical protein